MTKVLLWGAGHHCKEILAKYKSLKNEVNFEIVGIIDVKAVDALVKIEGISVLSPAEGLQVEYDYIVIASADFYDDIKYEIENKWGVEENKITYGGLIFYPDYSIGSRKERLAIATVVKNETQYLDEWIEYHRMLGVSKFYLYDNESTDELDKKMKKYSDLGIVNIIPCPGGMVQPQAFNHAIATYRDLHDYIAVIDVDEFLCPVVDGSIPEIIDRIIDKYEGLVDIDRSKGHFGGLGLNWTNFGTSGLKERTEGLVIEQHKFRTPKNYFKNMVIKTIYNPRTVDSVINAHHGIYKEGFCCISENGSYIPGWQFMDGRGDLIRLHHYYAKSDQEFIEKFMLGWPAKEQIITEEYARNRLRAYNGQANKERDDIMDRFIPMLKGRLNL